MARASKRRRQEMHEQNLMLNPMMDMFAVLIPALMMMSVVVEVSSINVAAPTTGEASAAKKQEVPLTYTVTVKEKGYLLQGRGVPLGADGQPAANAELDISIPVVERKVDCARYRNAVPPPRTLNAKRAVCKGAGEERRFFVYDTEALRRTTVALKERYPEERMIVVGAESPADFESIADVMDATRDMLDAKGAVRPLFDQVAISSASLK